MAIAGTVLIPVAKQILGKASELASNQVGLLWNFKRELEKLKDTVSRIQAVLRDAEEKQFHNHQVRLWLEELSDVMYDADDLLDDLSTEARRKAIVEEAAADGDEGRGGSRTSATAATCWSLVCFLFSSLPKQLAYDLRMAHHIVAIRERLDVISKEKEAFHLEARPDQDEGLPSRETDSCPPTIVVGREDDKQNIIKLLLNSNLEATISVVPIVGMGGLGKTTLAQLVYDDNRVNDHFNTKAWIYVSQSFDVKVILGKMLRSINCQAQSCPELDKLQAQLRKEIGGKRFLFVLDDVWEETNHDWESLGKYLTVGAPGSKVLVTTRSRKVAEVAAGALKSRESSIIVDPYLLKGLSEAECWSLLVGKALPREVPQDPQVQEIGKKILRKCVGVPLAVSTIAGVLTDSQDPETEWPSLLGENHSRGGAEDPTMSALRLSFDHLPPHMKHCFIYCKLFPKGDRLDIQMLVQFWVIQGYVESEDQGFDCFKILWWRSFFQEVEKDESGIMSTCRMHDLMHDLADSMPGKSIVRGSGSSTMLKNVPSRTRHLLITRKGVDGGPKEEGNGGGTGNANKVRTLIVSRYLSAEELEQVLDNFLRLRILVIAREGSSWDGEDSLLNSVDRLKHLRYLGLNCTGRRKLPNSIANLVNLQVLRLIDADSLQEMPKDAKKLVNLKHLKLIPRYAGLTHMPKGIGEFKLIQKLPSFVLGKRVGAGLEELGGLNALCGELTIKHLANADPPRTNAYVLKEKIHLQSLVLDWSSNSGFVPMRLWLALQENLDDATSTHEEILQMLQPHPNLKKLMIQGAGVFRGTKLPDSLSGITNLVEFSLQSCDKCRYLPRQLHQMPSLKKLTIEDCRRLKGINGNDDHCDPSLHNSTTSSASEEEGDEWPRFHCLAHLCIRNCPMLTRFPTFPTVRGELVLENVSLAPFARTIKMKMRRGEGEGGALLHPLSKLTKLTLSDTDDDLERLESLPEEGLRNLTSLQHLYIASCPRLASLPPAMRHLTSLQSLRIRDCERLRKRCKEDDWPNISHIPRIQLDEEILQGDDINM